MDHRPLWKGSLAFGIVTIPVELVGAVRSHDLHFHQISRIDRRRIRYKKVAEGNDEEVAANDIVKGYAVKPGQYVVFDDDELARLASRKSRIMDLVGFVDLAEIDPLYFDQPYRLVPAEGGEKPYRLLVATLERTARCGIAQLIMHGKEHVVAIRALHHGLMLHTLRYADEIVTPPRSPTKATVAARELAMAEQLVSSLAMEFDPAAFTDEYQARVSAAIARKAKGKTLEIEESGADEPGDGKVISLMEALERSLKKERSPKKERPLKKLPLAARRKPRRAPSEARRKRA